VATHFIGHPQFALFIACFLPWFARQTSQTPLQPDFDE
jgi:hypothetical protein